LGEFVSLPLFSSFFFFLAFIDVNAISQILMHSLEGERIYELSFLFSFIIFTPLTLLSLFEKQIPRWKIHPFRIQLIFLLYLLICFCCSITKGLWNFLSFSRENYVLRIFFGFSRKSSHQSWTFSGMRHSRCSFTLSSGISLIFFI